MELYNTKRVRNSIDWALAGGSIHAVMAIVKKLQQKSINPDAEINWTEIFHASIKTSFKCAVAGFIVGAVEDYENRLVVPIDTDTALRDHVKCIRLSKNDPRYLRLLKKADSVTSLLVNEFGSKLHCKPSRGGSTEKGIALKRKFDIDVYLEFSVGSFRSTKEMYDSVLDFLSGLEGEHSIVRVVDQKKSVGVYLFCGGMEYKMDVVPCKLSKKGKNVGVGYLFVNDQSLIFNNCSYTKTNFRSLARQKLGSSQETVYLLLKNWKLKERLPFSSYLLLNIVLDAYRFNRGRIPKNITDKVVMVWDHIVTYLDSAVIRSIENTNNILSDIPANDKQAIIDACKRAIREFEYQPNSIVQVLK